MNPLTITRVTAIAVCGAILVYVACFAIPHGAHFWIFDHRAVQHFFGYWGLSLLVQGCVAGAYSREAWVVHFVMSCVILAAAWFVHINPTVLPLSEQLNALKKLVLKLGTPSLIPVLLFIYVVRNRYWWPTALVGIALCFSFSWYWELYLQPKVGVYGGPPRHFIQWSQVIGDALGITLGFMTLWCVSLPKVAPWRKQGRCFRFIRRSTDAPKADEKRKRRAS